MPQTELAQADPIGTIRVSTNGRYFVDRHGKPVFWLGDTQWELFRLFYPDQALHVLKDRQAKGFNIILIMLTGVDVGRTDPEKRAQCANLEGEQPWIDEDPLRPNEAYFRHVDAMIRLGGETGQTFVVGVYHQWHAPIITLPKARHWARWVAERYRDVPNLIWSMYPKATDEFIPVCQEIAAGLRAGDGGAHLISVHPDPSVASSSFIHDQKWLAFNMIQTCISYDQIHETVTSDYGRTPAKPVVMAEGGYEGLEFGRLQTAHQIRQQAYWTQLAGGHHVYGHQDAWQAPSNWAAWIDSPGSRHLRVFQEVITSCDEWWDLIPDQSILAAGAGDGYHLNVAARSAIGDWMLAYLSEPSTVSIRLEPITASRQARALWIDPTNGSRLPIGTFVATGTRSFTCPESWKDALLLIEAG
jgi:hypothetical protein